MNNVLYIGFKGKNNASSILAEYLSLSPYLLTNSFEGVRKDLERINGNYDYVLMFGIDTNLKDSVRIERVARRQGVTLVSALNLEDIAKRLEQAGIENAVAEVPTQYLCNEAYWFALRKFVGKAVFIHIPPMKYIDGDFLEKMKKALSKVQHLPYEH